MFRKVDDFAKEWRTERDATLSVLNQLTDESLSQMIAPGGRTLGFLAWHLIATLTEMPKKAGVDAGGPEHEPPAGQITSATDIVTAYSTSSTALLEAVVSQWTDEMLMDEVEMYGDMWTRGFMLDALIRHEAHHRGQMTVLMRQAGLIVPGVYGPAREQWAQWGMAAPA